MNTYKLPPGTLYVLQIQNLHIQINLRMPNPRQIITVSFQNLDGREHVEQLPLLNWSTLMAAAVAITVAVSGCCHRRCCWCACDKDTKTCMSCTSQNMAKIEIIKEWILQLCYGLYIAKPKPWNFWGEWPRWAKEFKACNTRLQNMPNHGFVKSKNGMGGLNMKANENSSNPCTTGKMVNYV